MTQHHELETPRLVPTRTESLRLRLNRRNVEQHVLEADELLFCPTTRSLPLGTQVLVNVVIHHGPRIFINGRVCWCRHRGVARDFRTGVGVQVEPSQRARLEFISAWFEGAAERRETTRYPLVAPIHYWVGSTQHFTFTRDASLGGIFVCAQRLVAIGEPIKLLMVGWIGQLTLTGRVVRQERRTRRHGMGIQLELLEGAPTRRYHALIEDTRCGFTASGDHCRLDDL